MRFTRFISLALLGAASAITQGEMNLVQLLKRSTNLSTLYKAIGSVPGLADTLAKAENVTLLAPTNKAFANLEKGTPEYKAVNSGNVKDLESLLLYHVVEGFYFYGSYTREGQLVKKVPTFAKTLLTSQDKFDGVTATEVSGGQNVELVIGKKAELVVSGELQTSSLSAADLEGKKVIIQELDEVLKIPRTPAETADDFGLTAIVGALEATGLASTVDGAKDLTIFVPANAAFEAIGNIVDSASVKTLKEVLEYHVISGSVVFSTDIKNEKVKSLGGQDLTLTVKDDTIFVDTAKVIIPNIITSNGVVHVIDTVLNPDSGPINRSKLSANSKPKPAFSGAKSKAVPVSMSAPPASTTLKVPQIATSAPALPTSEAAKDSSSSSSSNKMSNAAVGLNFNLFGVSAGLGAAVVIALAM